MQTYKGWLETKNFSSLRLATKLFWNLCLHFLGKKKNGFEIFTEGMVAKFQLFLGE